jgi:hypothetical protein
MGILGNALQLIGKFFLKEKLNCKEGSCNKVFKKIRHEKARIAARNPLVSCILIKCTLVNPFNNNKKQSHQPTKSTTHKILLTLIIHEHLFQMYQIKRS